MDRNVQKMYKKDRKWTIIDCLHNQTVDIKVPIIKPYLQEVNKQAYKRNKTSPNPCKNRC